MALNELVTKFDFVGDIAPLSEYNDQLGSSIGLIAGFGATTVAAAGFMASWVGSITAGIGPMLHLGTNTDMTTEAVQELGFAASVSGSSFEDMSMSLVELNKKIGEAAQKGSEDFARLGISVRDANGQVKGTEQLLFEVGQQFNRLNLSQAERADFAQKLGINPSVVQLISKSGTEIAALREEARQLGIVTQEEAEAAESYNDSLVRLGYASDGLKRSIAVGLAPQMEELSTGFTDFIKDNREIIGSVIGGAVKGITELGKAMIRLTPAFAVVAAGFVAMKVAAVGFSGVMGVILSPVVLVTAGIAAAVLAVDDLIVAFNGGKSVINDFFKDWFGIDLGEKLRMGVDAAKQMFSSIGDLFAVGFMSGLDKISSKVNEFIASIGGKVSGFFGGDTTVTAGTVTSADLDQLVPVLSPASGITNNSTIGGNTAINQDVSINIMSSDPVRAGEAVDETLQNQLREARLQTNRGGR